MPDFTACARSTFWATAWYSMVAVAPRIFLASAVSCTPGSSTTMRVAPCCWMTGSDTPSALTRLRRVARFWWMIEPSILSSSAGLSTAVST